MLRRRRDRFRTAYTRDSLSRITQLIERLNGVTDTTGFSYDSVGRLQTVTRNGTLAASYTYDLNGNRATKVTAGGTQTATVDDQDRLLSYGTASFHYTANGEVRRKIVGTDTTVFTYDALGNLTQVALPDGTEIGCQLTPHADRLKLDSGGAGDLGRKVSGGTRPRLSCGRRVL